MRETSDASDCAPGAQVLEQRALRGVRLDAVGGEQDADVLVRRRHQALRQLLVAQLVQQSEVQPVEVRLL